MQRGRHRGGGTRPLRARQRLLALGAGFVLSGAVYLLLIDTTSLPELYAGAAVALIGAIAFVAALEELGARLPGAAATAAAGCRALALVPADIVRVSVAALAQLFAPRRRSGTLRAVPFRRGSEARRAAVEALGSLAPNTIVIGVDRDRGLLLVHQLVRHGDSDSVDTTALG